MKKPNPLAGKVRFGLGIALLGTLTACTTYVEQPRAAYQEPPPPYQPPPPPRVEADLSPAPVVVVIRSEDDFYEPLSPYGRWEEVGPYGRCWVPARADPDWRPYCNGHWERTESGWYWASDEPWAWATYHYGRWDFSPRVGWYWVPQTQWAPAWVSFHRGDGYVGWAPLHPSSRFGSGGSIEVDMRSTPQRGYVFVEEKRFLEPVRPKTVVVNNTTIINKTVNITNIKIVNNTVINEGPRTQVIEQVSGRKIQQVPVHELRRKSEAEVVAKEKIAPPARERKVQTAPPPVRGEVGARQQNIQPDSQQRNRELQRQAQEEAQAKAKELERKAQVEADRRALDAQKKAQLESERRAKELEKRTQEEAQTKAKELERKAQLEADRRALEAQKKAQLESERRAKEMEKQAQEETLRNARQKQAQIEADRRAQASEKQAQRAAELRARQEQLAKEKAAKKPFTPEQKKKLAEEQKKKDQQQQPPPEKPAAPPPP